MSKKHVDPAVPPAPAPATDLEAKLCECAEHCGLAGHEAKAALAAPHVGAIGDGVLLGKLFDFIKLILPLILPLVMKDKPAA